LSAPNPVGYLNSSDYNSDFEDQGQQEGDNVDCDPTLEESCPLSDHHLLAQGYLNDIVCDLNKQAAFLYSRLKDRIFSPNNEICFFHNRQSEFKEFFFQENHLVLRNDICSFIETL
jgi:hypothetical protein